MQKGRNMTGIVKKIYVMIIFFSLLFVGMNVDGKSFLSFEKKNSYFLDNFISDFSNIHLSFSL
jgi:hypothetical protein